MNGEQGTSAPVVAPLGDEDLDWLTAVENRLLRMRKREVANNNTLGNEVTDAIQAVDWLRQMLGARFGREVKSVEE